MCLTKSNIFKHIKYIFIYNSSIKLHNYLRGQYFPHLQMRIQTENRMNDPCSKLGLRDRSLELFSVQHSDREKPHSTEGFFLNLKLRWGIGSFLHLCLAYFVLFSWVCMYFEVCIVQVIGNVSICLVALIIAHV